MTLFHYEISRSSSAGVFRYYELYSLLRVILVVRPSEEMVTEEIVMLRLHIQCVNRVNQIEDNICN